MKCLVCCLLCFASTPFGCTVPGVPPDPPGPTDQNDLPLVAVLTASRNAFPPPARDPVISFVTAFFFSREAAGASAGFSSDTLGDCTVQTWTGASASQSSDPYDAGGCGTAMTGGATAELTRSAAGDFAGRFVATTDTQLRPLLDAGFDVGATVTFEFPGGQDVEAFAASARIPEEVVLTTPEVLAGPFEVDVESGLDLAWVPGSEPAEASRGETKRILILLMGSNGVTAEDGSARADGTVSVTITCQVGDTGAFRLEPDLLNRIPRQESTNVAQPISLTVVRRFSRRIEVDLKDGKRGLLSLWGESTIVGSGMLLR